MNALLLTAVGVLVLTVLLMLAAASLAQRNGKSEGFVFFLLGPVPVFLRGRPWIALAAAAAVFLMFLLVLM
ncbi:MAG: hypothetical protein RMI43_05645 [Candidatus Caldarchaeum sp.]|nr:hypothetical protein [Candidatus Caldarchaeum sp.]